MTDRRRTVAALVVCVVAALAPAGGIYVNPDTREVPVARLVANLEQQLAATPSDPELHIRLARLFGMSYAVNAESLPVLNLTGGKEAGKEEVWFGHEPDLIPHRLEGKVPPERGKAAREYLQKSLAHYRRALELNPDSLLARLGHAWALEQSGDKARAVAEYRQVISRAWPKEQSVRTGGLGDRFYTVEAAEYLLPLLDPKKDAAEIAELRERSERLNRLPRMITPVAVPLRDSMPLTAIVDLDARVRFDADGSGRRDEWTWITRDAGWLVYDPHARRSITSALQWFGNVTFWLFWPNGYEALRALDDDASGELDGSELRHLAIWRDADADGRSGHGEVQPLAFHDITAVSWRYVAGDGLLAAASSPSGVRLSDGRRRATHDIVLRRSRDVSAP